MKKPAIAAVLAFLIGATYAAPAPIVTSPTNGAQLGPNTDVIGKTEGKQFVVIITDVYVKGEYIKSVPGHRHWTDEEGNFSLRLATPRVGRAAKSDTVYKIRVFTAGPGGNGPETVVTASAKHPMDQRLAGRLQAILVAAVENAETEFPGALLHISSRELGTWAGAAGLGDAEPDAPMAPGDAFRAGSIMKMLVAATVLQLAEEGKLSLDDPLSALTPEDVSARFAHSARITVRMLLNHTSGIPDWLTGEMMAKITANPQRVWDVGEFIDAAAAQEPYFAPGEAWRYSNTNYSLLGLIIEGVTEHSWREQLRERIIRPLGLTRTLLPEPGTLSVPGRHAHGYMPVEGELVDYTATDPSMAGAAGGSALVTTAQDLSRFLDALLTGSLFRDRGTLQRLLAFVPTDGEATDPQAYGLGIEKRVLPGGVEALGHLGGTAGFASAAVHVPDRDITIVAMVNTMDVESVQRHLLTPALQALLGE